MQIDGKEIFVEEIQGNGILNFVLIHNAGGNHQFFHHQIETLKKYGNIILLDLPGHGKSENLAHYNMSDLASVIVKISEKLSLKNISFIGLNNGANIIIDIALNHALPISSLVLIDPPLFMKPSFNNEINHFIQKLEEPNLNEFVSSLVESIFIKTTENNKKIAYEAFMNVDKVALQKIFKGLLEWDKTISNKLHKITYPTLCILTDEHHCTYQKMHEEAPHIEIGKVIGSKCWATLEVPAQVNAMIERFIALTEIPAF